MTMNCSRPWKSSIKPSNRKKERWDRIRDHNIPVTHSVSINLHLRFLYATGFNLITAVGWRWLHIRLYLIVLTNLTTVLWLGQGNADNMRSMIYVGLWESSRANIRYQWFHEGLLSAGVYLLRLWRFIAKIGCFSIAAWSFLFWATAWQAPTWFLLRCVSNKVVRNSQRPMRCFSQFRQQKY
jgi:hypothetical protein